MNKNSTSTKLSDAIPGPAAEPAGLRETRRTRIRRGRRRASYDRGLAYEILDEGLVCHVGFVSLDGDPVVIPTAYARDGDRLVIHGSRSNRMLRTLADGRALCVTVTLLDGIVVARAALHTSMNYRSLVLFGRATAVEDDREHRRLLDLLVDHALPGHSSYVRPPSDKELALTSVFAVPIDEASLKVRGGGPEDEPADLDLGLWAGRVPVAQVAGVPQADDRTRVAGIEVPDHLRERTPRG